MFFVLAYLMLSNLFQGNWTLATLWGIALVGYTCTSKETKTQKQS